MESPIQNRTWQKMHSDTDKALHWHTFRYRRFHLISHDMKTNDKKELTSENGRPIPDNQNTQTAGHRGPVTLQDTWLLEKMAHFDREVIPE